MSKGAVNVDAFDFVPTLTSEHFSGVKVSCVAYTEQHILVGTTEGQVCMYRVNTQVNERKEVSYEASFFMQKGLGKKQPVQQMEVNNTLGFLIVLCGDAVFVHNIKSQTLSRTNVHLPNDKVDSFTVDHRDPYRLCLSIKGKKRLRLFEYLTVEKRYELRDELQLPEKVLAMAWRGNSICVGFKSQYTIIRTDGKGITPVDVPLGGGATPCMQVIDEEKILLAASLKTSKKDKTANPYLGVFINFNGEPVTRNPVLWEETPDKMATCGHFLICLLPNDEISIISLLNAHDQKVVQKITFAGGVSLCSFVPSSGELSAAKVFIAAPEFVATLCLSPMAKQIKQYLRLGFVAEALTLLKKTNPTEKDIESFHAEAGFVVMTQLYFAKAMYHFGLSQIDPREVLSMFPQLCLEEMQYETACPYIPTMKRYYRKTNTEKEVPMSIDTIINKGLGAKQSSENKQEIALSRLDPVFLEEVALMELGNWLWGHRNRIENTRTKIMVDTALLFICIRLEKGVHLPKQNEDVAIAGKMSSLQGLTYTMFELLFPNNSVFMEPAVRFLISNKKYTALGLLYQSDGQYKKALEQWAKLGNGEYKEEGGCDGVYETVQLLQTLPEGPLIWEHSEWVLETSPRQGLEIFTSSKRDDEFDHDKVLKHLGGIRVPEVAFNDNPGNDALGKRYRNANDDVSGVADGDDHNDDEEEEDDDDLVPVDLVEAYLEHVVNRIGSKNPKYHDQLAVRYLRKVQALHDSMSSFDGKLEAGKEPALLGRHRRKLLDFLRSSRYYHVPELLPKAIQAGLNDETIVLYSKLGKHKEVLRVYIQELDDHEGAVQYALQVEPSKSLIDDSKQDDEAVVDDVLEASQIAQRYARDKLRSEVFVLLISLYFRAEPGEDGTPAEWKRAIDILNNFSTHINPVEALKVIPPYLPITDLGRYLRRVIPHTIHERREAQVIKGLSRIENLQTRSELMQKKRRCIPVGPDDKCPVCKKTVPAIFKLHWQEDSVPVHHHCYDNYTPPKAKKNNVKAKSAAYYN